MKNKGWVKLYRVQFVHWLSKKPWCDSFAWCYLYSQANHKQGMLNFRNEYIKVERGQLVTSKKKLMKIFGWTRRHVENFLKALNVDNMITHRMTHRYTLITIIKYEFFQSNDKQSDIQNDTQSDRQMADRRPTGDHKQECIKNDLRRRKKLTRDEIEKNKKLVTESRKHFLDIMKGKKKE